MMLELMMFSNPVYSGGIDRTGVLIAMETALSKMEIVEPLYPLEIVRIMRDQRSMMLPAVVSTHTCTYIHTCDPIWDNHL